MSNQRYVKIGEPEIKMIEELGEVLQALGKGLRFGWDKYNPEDPTHDGNAAQLDYEMQDLTEAYGALRTKITQAEGKG